MKTWEKFYSLFTLVFLAALAIFFFLLPEYRTLQILISTSLLALCINILFMFIVFRDIYMRKFSNPNLKYIWFALILFLWPTTLIYLFKHGLKQR